MDIIEEFLELTKTVTGHFVWSHLSESKMKRYVIVICVCSFVWPSKASLATVIELTRILRRRIPSRYLPKLGLYYMVPSLLKRSPLKSGDFRIPSINFPHCCSSQEKPS